MKKIVKLTESDIERIVRKTLNEDHAKSDSDKIGYIISALDNLSSEDLDKVYNMVEDLDPEYQSTHKGKLTLTDYNKWMDNMPKDSKRVTTYPSKNEF